MQTARDSRSRATRQLVLRRLRKGRLRWSFPLGLDENRRLHARAEDSLVRRAPRNSRRPRPFGAPVQTRVRRRCVRSDEVSQICRIQHPHTHPPLMKIELCRHSGPTSISIDAEILKDGDLQISGHDLGAAPLELMGDSDYDYWLTIRSAQKDRLLQFLQEGKENPVAVPSGRKRSPDSFSARNALSRRSPPGQQA